jgi:hypothetical protein
LATTMAIANAHNPRNIYKIAEKETVLKTIAK